MPVEHHEDPFEDRLGGALRQAGEAFQADGATLVTGGEVRGRRLLRRRRATVVGGVAGVALAGVGGALLVPWGGGGNGASVAGDPKPRLSPSATASATPSEPVSGDQLLRTLKDLLPEGKFSGEGSRGTDARQGPNAHLVYDDGKGRAAIGISMDRVEPGSRQAREVTTCPAKELTPHDACSTNRLPDGSLLMIFQGYEYPDRRVDTKWWNAELVSPEGHHVSLSEWNSAAEKDAPISRSKPPLSPEQMKKVVTAEAWRTAVDAIPKASQAPTATASATAPDQPSAVDGSAIRQTLVSLLPKDVKVVSKGGQESEYGFVVVDDGKGKTFVQINVQPGMSDVEDQLFGPDAEVLPDGTKVTTRQGPSDDKGATLVMWTADTLRTDGLRVVVSAFNSGSQRTAPTRATPALSMADLKKIATSEEWERLVQTG